MPAPRNSETEFLAIWNDHVGFPSVADIAKRLDLHIDSVRHRASNIRRREGGPFVLDRGKQYRADLNRIGRERGPRTSGGNVRKVVAPPARIDRWLVTAAQDETVVSEPFWSNLLAYAEEIGARLVVGGFTYQKGLFEDHATRTAVFADKVQPYLLHENEMLGPLLFAAKMNILPTATRPLSGLETYSRGAWCIFPHAKRQLVSVPALRKPISTPSSDGIQATTFGKSIANSSASHRSNISSASLRPSAVSSAQLEILSRSGTIQ